MGRALVAGPGGRGVRSLSGEPHHGLGQRTVPEEQSPASLGKDSDIPQYRPVVERLGEYSKVVRITRFATECREVGYRDPETSFFDSHQCLVSLQPPWYFVKASGSQPS